MANEGHVGVSNIHPWFLFREGGGGERREEENSMKMASSQDRLFILLQGFPPPILPHIVTEDPSSRFP